MTTKDNLKKKAFIVDERMLRRAKKLLGLTSEEEVVRVAIERVKRFDASSFGARVAHSVRFHPEAAEEAEASVDWYRQRSSDAAAGFVAELGHAVDRVAEFPETWPSYIDDTRRFVFRV